MMKWKTLFMERDAAAIDNMCRGCWESEWNRKHRRVAFRTVLTDLHYSNNIFLLSFLLQHGYSFSSRWKIRKQKSTELVSKYSQHKQKELLRYDDYALSEMHFWRISENVRFSQSFRKKWKTAIVSRYWMTNMLHPALDFLFLYFSVAFRKSPCFYFSYWFKLKMKLKFIIVIKRLQYSNVYLDPG